MMLHRATELCISLRGAPLRARVFGSGSRAVVLSNMASNDERGWDELIPAALQIGACVVTYSYPASLRARLESLDRLLDAVVSELGATQIALAGASLGALLSLRAAARRELPIDCVAAISVPKFVRGREMLPVELLRRVTVPKLIACSEFEPLADDARRVFAELEDPKRITLYPGDAHGTEIFADQPGSLSQELVGFFESSFCR